MIGAPVRWWRLGRPRSAPQARRPCPAAPGPSIATWVGAAGLAGGLLLAGCAGGPKPADWLVDAAVSLERADAAHLRGEGRVEAAELRRMRAALAAAGRTDLRARAELAHCAAQAASLSTLEAVDPCPAFAAFRDDADDVDRAYAEHLAGRGEAVAPSRLPPTQRQAARGVVDGAALRSIDDPLSRLVAAAVARRTHRLRDDAVDVAVETAAAQGWRRALLAWLEVQQQRADATGRAAESARIQRRIDLVSGELDAR